MCFLFIYLSIFVYMCRRARYGTEPGGGEGGGRGGSALWHGHQAIIFLFFWFTQLTCLSTVWFLFEWCCSLWKVIGLQNDWILQFDSCLNDAVLYGRSQGYKMTEFYSLIPVWMMLFFMEGHRVTKWLNSTVWFLFEWCCSLWKVTGLQNDWILQFDSCLNDAVLYGRSQGYKMTEFYSLIPVWMMLFFMEGHRVTKWLNSTVWFLFEWCCSLWKVTGLQNDWILQFDSCWNVVVFNRRW